MGGSSGLDRAVLLVSAAKEAGVTARLLGGMAFQAIMPDWSGRASASQPDFDFVVARADRAEFSKVLEREGWVGDRVQNALHADRQLYFSHPDGLPAVDVIVDRLVMCHTLDLRERLHVQSPTIPAADLLLSKLQIVRMNEKDAIDMLVLLAAHSLAGDDEGGISLPRIVGITSSDWGWWRTVTGNLGRLLGRTTSADGHGNLGLSPAQVRTAVEQIAELRAAIDTAPKSARWRIRNSIGDRVQWYDEPEEVERPEGDEGSRAAIDGAVDRQARGR